MLDIVTVPRSLKDPAAVEARRALLSEPHIAPLTAYVNSLRSKYPDWEFPDFDPLDGGVKADLLFLLEKPGPMTSPQHKRKGSGFISRDNNDSTAEAVFKFMEQAAIGRKRTLLWNTIPGWNGKRAIGAGEVRSGLAELSELLILLPSVHTIVLVGGKATRAEKSLRKQGYRIECSAHPGPLVKGPNRALWNKIPEVWKRAASKFPEG
ncbi:uracil-DNA glycosylase [Herbaspirillum sp. NPDC087042]|uniref:uracil-DNA glycosylase n=1 Tax=Herbaspirillum sp. NPDC087042 TaxID=3364004 RepID=UPI00380091CD